MSKAHYVKGGFQAFGDFIDLLVRSKKIAKKNT